MRPDPLVVRAAARWVRLLGSSTVEQAASILRNSSAYSDIPLASYQLALDFLREGGLIIELGYGAELAPRLNGLAASDAAAELYEHVLRRWSPAWLDSPELLMQDADDMPADGLAVAEALGLREVDAARIAKRLPGKIDLELRAEIGLKGEAALVDELRKSDPSLDIRHVSLLDDSLGYDIAVYGTSADVHLEVKSTTRRGHLSVHVSRNEFEVGRADPHWRLVVVALSSDYALVGLATVRGGVLARRAPRDVTPHGTWESMRVTLLPEDLEYGLPGMNSLDLGSAQPSSSDVAWLPPRVL